MHRLSIGSLHLPSCVVLAPLAGISDMPYRLMNRKFGCCFAFTEMISSRSLVNDSRRTLRMLSSPPQDRPLGVQLVGSEAPVLAHAIKLLEPFNFDVIDLNAACPARKVVGVDQGAALMRDPLRLEALVRAMVAASDAPVTVKIRSGWDNESRNAVEVALRAQDAGAQAVFIHGRTRAQGYGGRVSYENIAQVKQALEIPVIGSGDVFSSAQVLEMLEQTGCDGVTVARGGLGNPWIFSEIQSALAGKQAPSRPAPAEIAACMLEHLDMCVDLYGEEFGIKRFRKIFAWYTKGFHRIRPLRSAAFTCKTRAELAANIAHLETMRMDSGCTQRSVEDFAGLGGC
jgi:tRNA-dihydrouridine synthase B